MKYIIILLVLLCFYNTKAQLPTIEANIIYNDKNSSVPFQYLRNNNYEFAISYYIPYSGWKMNNDTYYNILAYKRNTWKKLLLIYNGDLKGLRKIEKKRIKKQNAERLINELTRNNFWSLSLDSLNIRQMPVNNIAKNEVKGDTVFVKANIIRSFRMLDGTTYLFEILQNGKVKILSCESPESYNNTFPEIKSTQSFIKAKNAFEEFLKKN